MTHIHRRLSLPKFAKTLLASLPLAMAFPVHATIWCTGQITNSYVSSAGDVVMLAPWLPGYEQICNLNSTWNGVSPTSCKGWLSIVELATVTGKNVTVQFNDGVVSSCSTIPGYQNSPAPNYVMLAQ